MNAQSLSPIAEANPTAKALFAELAQRKQARTETNIDQVDKILRDKFGSTIDYNDLVHAFDELQKRGVGKVIYSKVEPPKFLWNVDLTHAGRVALGDKSIVLKPFSAENPAPTDQPEPVIEQVQPTVTQHETRTTKQAVRFNKDGTPDKRFGNKKAGRPKSVKNKRTRGEIKKIGGVQYRVYANGNKHRLTADGTLDKRHANPGRPVGAKSRTGTKKPGPKVQRIKSLNQAAMFKAFQKFLQSQIDG